MQPTDASARRPLRVALLGLGTVGSAVAGALLDPAWRAAVAARGIAAPELIAVGVRDPERARGVALPPRVRRTGDLLDLAADPTIDVVVEVIGGTDTAGVVVRQAMAAGKAVVTANKALLAEKGPALEQACRDAGVALRCEAAVAGGIPVLGPLVHDLAANRIEAVRGIVNGTTNHILSAMAQDGRPYAEVLAEAQERGYAEADPSGDVEGHDAANKLAILARLAFGAWPDVRRIRVAVPAVVGDAAPGITCVRADDLAGARALGMTIKLVARAVPGADAVRAAVTPVAVGAASPLGATGGVTNLVEIDGAPVGRVSLRGPGAGGPATASAVLGDLLALARGEGSTWDPLPVAGWASAVADDLDGERSWLVAPGPAAAPAVADVLGDAVLVQAEGAFLTRPVALAALRARLAGADPRLPLYPAIPEV
ncbi:MAG: homoserine dehydrogenase [Chloroflexota bacterium]